LGIISDTSGDARPLRISARRGGAETRDAGAIRRESFSSVANSATGSAPASRHRALETSVGAGLPEPAYGTGLQSRAPESAIGTGRRNRPTEPVAGTGRRNRPPESAAGAGPWLAAATGWCGRSC
jgi:hypothetical protein